MKTVTEYVDGLSIEDLKKSAIREVESMLQEVDDSLWEMNNYAIFDLPRLEIYKKFFLELKGKIEGMGLWNPKYDEVYNIAIQGKLNLKKLTLEQ